VPAPDERAIGLEHVAPRIADERREVVHQAAGVELVEEREKAALGVGRELRDVRALRRGEELR
jgi:hypothetical protein